MSLETTSLQKTRPAISDGQPIGSMRFGQAPLVRHIDVGERQSIYSAFAAQRIEYDCGLSTSAEFAVITDKRTFNSCLICCRTPSIVVRIVAGMLPVIRLPKNLERQLATAASTFLHPEGSRKIDFAEPRGERALTSPDSVSWRIFKNPIALFVGGVAAVILELAEPAVRTAIWEHSSFRDDPLSRLRRTGLAALVTVYGARRIAEPMIAAVVRIHTRIAGETPAGRPYSASDARLLTWVQATAAFGFAQAYNRYVERLSLAQIDAVYREGAPASQLYGAPDAPQSDGELQTLFGAMRGRLEPSPVIFQFLRIMGEVPAFPAPLLWLQRMLVRAAVETIPDWSRQCLGLNVQYGLRRGERNIVAVAGALANRIVIPESPPVRSCVRLGLPTTYLYATTK